MKKSTLKKVSGIYSLILLGLILLTLTKYRSLPDIIPIQWSGNGEPSGTIAKNLYLLSLFMLFVGTSLISFLTSRDLIKEKGKTENLILLVALALLIIVLALPLFNAI